MRVEYGAKISSFQEIVVLQKKDTAMELISNDHFFRFKQGDEEGLTYLYKFLHKSLLRHGLRIVSDEFVVNSSIQEAFLKAWNFRERLTSVLHTYRFLRLNVTWKCYNYYREPDRLHRRIVYTDSIDNYSNVFFQQEIEETEQAFALTEEMLKTVYNVIPYLPATRKTIFTLHFKYGLSYKQIAKRFATNSQAITHELQRGLEQLKKVIHNKKRLDVVPTAINKPPEQYSECLQGELLQLFRLRYENKWSFEAIAAQMNLSLAYVQQQYIAAHRLLNQMNRSSR